MAKTLSLVALLFVVLTVLPSCKKCFSCVNACSICTKTDSLGAVVERQTLYSDSVTYLNAVTTLKDSGYTCVKGPSTYQDDFCVNTGTATNQYLPYHEGNGRYTCSPK